MITLICGPMFSGKTTEMLRLLERAYVAKKKTILLRPEMDSRGFLSHSKKDVSWLEERFVGSLEGLSVKNYDVVGIDEGQFHLGLKDFCLDWSLLGKKIVISALHATSECEMFDQVTEVIPYCDYMVKLNAICTGCGSESGSYTAYLAGDKTEKVSVGGSEDYTALCSDCFFDENKVSG